MHILAENALQMQASYYALTVESMPVILSTVYLLVQTVF